MWGAIWSAIIGFVLRGLGLGQPKVAPPTSPTVNDVLKGTADNEQAVTKETQKVVQAGNTAELTSAVDPGSLREPDPFSRD